MPRLGARLRRPDTELIGAMLQAIQDFAPPSVIREARDKLHGQRASGDSLRGALKRKLGSKRIANPSLGKLLLDSLWDSLRFGGMR